MAAIEALAERPLRQRWLLLAASLAISLAALVAVTLLALTDPGRATLEDLSRSPIGLLVLFVVSALSTATVLLPAPGMALTFVAGMGGEPVVVGIVAGVGQGVGEMTGYLAGLAGAATLASQARLARPVAWLQRHGAGLIFLLALLPNPFFDVAGLAAGALGMRLRLFLAAVIAGRVIKSLLLAFLGDGWLNLLIGG